MELDKAYMLRDLMKRSKEAVKQSEKELLELEKFLIEIDAPAIFYALTDYRVKVNRSLCFLRQGLEDQRAIFYQYDNGSKDWTYLSIKEMNEDNLTQSAKGIPGFLNKVESILQEML